MQTFDIKLNTANGIVEVPGLNISTYLPKRYVSTSSAVTLNAGNNGWPKYSASTTLMPYKDSSNQIMGYDSATFLRAGKNLLRNPGVETKEAGGAVFTIASNGSVHVTGNNLGAKPNIMYLSSTTSIVGLPTGVELTLSGASEHVRINISYRAGNNAYTYTSSLHTPEVSFTIPNDYKSISILLMADEGLSTIDETVYPMVRLASDADYTWEAYAGNCVTVQFQDPPGTVYGGIVDFTAGTLTVTHTYCTFDGRGSQGWTYNSEYGYVVLNTATEGGGVPQMKRGNAMGADDGAICDLLPYSSSGSVMGIRFGSSNNLPRIYVYKVSEISASITTANAWKSWLQSNPINVTYPLANPIVYQLSQISMPELSPGINTLFTEPGDITVTWYASQEFGPSAEEIMPAPVIVTQPTDQSVEAGNTVTLTVSATGAFSYQWQYSNNGGNTWRNNTVAGNDTNTMSFVAGTNMNGRMYRCVVGNTVSSTISDAVTLTVSDT